MQKKLWLVVGLAAALSLTACGNSEKSGGVNSVVDKIVADAAGNQSGAEANGKQNGKGADKDQASVDADDNQDAAAKKEDTQANSPSGTIAQMDFAAMGNSPQNLMYNGGKMAFDAENLYYVQFQKLYQSDYSGETVKMIEEDEASWLNRRGDYLYYIMRNSIKRYHVETGEIEAVLEVDTGEDISRAGKGYQAYHNIDRLFVIEDYLIYTEMEGYSGTSGNQSMKVQAMDVNDRSVYTILETDNCTTDVRLKNIYTTDGEYIYSVGEMILKMPLADIKNGGMLEEIIWTGSEELTSYLVGTNGFCFAGDDDNEGKYYFCQFDTMTDTDGRYANSTEILDTEALGGYTEFDLQDGHSFIVGSNFFNTTRNRVLYSFKNMDFANYEKLEFEYMDAVGAAQDRLYVIDYDKETAQTRLTTIDPDCSVTQTYLIPEAIPDRTEKERSVQE